MNPADGPAEPLRQPAPFLGVRQSVTGRAWYETAVDPRTAAALAQRLDIPEVMGRVLAARGVVAEDGERFLNPSLRHSLPDPARLRDMDKAVARLVAAIRQGEPIAVFGDYDVDGATSAALLLRFLASLGIGARSYVPDRRREGYGPNTRALLGLRAEGTRVVILVDCGTQAAEPLAAAQAAGLDCIVLDHHQAELALPPAHAIVNPNRLDECGEHRQLAAVGVTFLFLVALNRALRQAGWYGEARPEPDLMRWLDLVALGTVADVMPLTGLNRVLVAQGLKVLARRETAGLRALADVARLGARADTYALGFVFAPRVNAGGRVGESDLGLRLLTTDDADEALNLALQLDRLNGERQAIEAAVLAQALGEAERQANLPCVVVASDGWHEGVVGIVAARLKEKFRRPAFVLSVAEGRAKGSGRSVPGIDLGAAVTAARQGGLVQAGGGHAMAAGVTLAAERLAEFHAFLCARMADAALSGEAVLRLDGALGVKAATMQLVELLRGAGPYGVGHPEPRFALPGVRVVRVQPRGRDHLAVTLVGGDEGRIDGIAFRAADGPLGQALSGALGGSRLHVAGTLRCEEWQGRRRLSLSIEDAAHAAGGPA